MINIVWQLKDENFYKKAVQTQRLDGKTAKAEIGESFASFGYLLYESG